MNYDMPRLSSQDDYSVSIPDSKYPTIHLFTLMLQVSSVGHWEQRRKSRDVLIQPQRRWGWMDGLTKHWTLQTLFTSRFLISFNPNRGLSLGFIVSVPKLNRTLTTGQVS